MNIKDLRKRIERVAQAAGTSPRPEYLPRFPRTLDGAVRCVLERHAGNAIERGEAKVACGDLERASDSELLAVQGYSPDLQGLEDFMIVKQHWIAVMMHNFKLPHNCGAYCPRKPGCWERPFVPRAAVFLPEYERLVAEHAERKRKKG